MTRRVAKVQQVHTDKRYERNTALEGRRTTNWCIRMSLVRGINQQETWQWH